MAEPSPKLPPGITLDAPKPPPGITLDTTFKPSLPIPGAEDIIPPIVNFLDYPVRDLSARIVAAFKGGMPTDDASRKSFYKEYEKSLPFAAIPETPLGQKISKVASWPGQMVGAGIEDVSNRLLGKQTTKELAPYAGAAADLAPYAGGKLAATRATPAAKAARQAAADLKIDNFVNTQYVRAIKPSVAGKSTGSLLDKYQDQVSTGIKRIVDDKANLAYADSSTGLPKSLWDFKEAIEQTKDRVFKEYDAKAREAGDLGATVPLAPVSSELMKVAENPIVNDLHPELAKYATEKANALGSRGEYTAVQAQEAIQNLNRSLDAFYKNPTYDTASRASIDSMIANRLRGSLDSAIEQATSPGYQELKNQYGALRAIEKDVVHRAIVETRKNAGGGLMGNIGDIISADEVIRGVMHFRPESVATGIGLKAVTTFVKYLRDPNRAVRRLFEAADRKSAELSKADTLPPKIPPGQQPPRPVGKEQELYGGAQTPEQDLASRGGARLYFSEPPTGVKPVPLDPFLTPPGGGQVR